MPLLEGVRSISTLHDFTETQSDLAALPASFAKKTFRSGLKICRQNVQEPAMMVDCVVLAKTTCVGDIVSDIYIRRGDRGGKSRW